MTTRVSADSLMNSVPQTPFSSVSLETTSPGRAAHTLEGGQTLSPTLRALSECQSSLYACLKCTGFALARTRRLIISTNTEKAIAK